MPAYEYQCDACDVRFERRQKMSDAPLENCPQCGGHARRLISGGAGAITKGRASTPASMPCGMSGPCCGGGACMPDGAAWEQ